MAFHKVAIELCRFHMDPSVVISKKMKVQLRENMHMHTTYHVTKSNDL